MASIKRDDSKQKWEETEFPLVCETCLGDNPYIRMTKEAHGKKCTVCEIPFTVFSWQAGTKGRLKKVEICRNCARTKNVCQVCIYDLQYGLPVSVRDKILAEHGASGGGVAAPPQSDANLSWFAQSQARAIENGTAGTVVPEMASVKLKQMARMEPMYERNLPKLCTFHARGECDRGSKCPFRHEIPRDRNDPLSKQNTRDRFYGTRDPVADKIWGKMKDKEEWEKKEARERGEEEGSSTSTTLFIRYSNNDSQITEMDLRDKFYSYGEIIAIRFAKTTQGAFIEYSSRAAAEHALQSTGIIIIKQESCYVSWARIPKRGNQSTEAPNQTGETHTALLPPLGGFPLKSIKPSGFVPRRPPAEVTAAAARYGSTSFPRINPVPRPSSVPRPGGGVPRPGGGVIRKIGVSVRAPAPKPYYPSQDPGRLGSRAH